jgi:threonine aldolase
VGRGGGGARAGDASGSLAYALASRGDGGDAHFPRPAVLALENTHNRCGGAVLPQAWVDDACAAAHAHGMAVHMDGARLLNACAASGLSPAAAVAGCDTVSLCMSKALGAPLGSLLAGPAAVIKKAHRMRKALGGGMRQAGVAAAAAIVGLRDVRPLLPADHGRARTLARGLAAVRGLAVDVRAVQTNIVFFDIDAAALDVAALRARAAAGAADAQQLLDACPAAAAAASTGAAFVALLAHFAAGTKIGSYGTHRLRAVVHYQIADEDIERAIVGAGLAAQALRVA